MTADDEVRNIHWTLGKIHQALHQMDKEFEKALPEVNYLSTKLEQIITDIANEANNIRNLIVKIVSNKYDTKTLIYYSPSLTSFDMPYDKSGKEWWIEMHNLDNQGLLQREKV
ncbi:unnamed protein product [Wuchereria bancrofti]|uniref:Uncharacterized protein n=1 Tax=Wuchereria bancrofti TaxID=6293 RepID=A0A3P7FCN5_WUCBA|nr:unnamed protein product [Wuchereria bancrofti]